MPRQVERILRHPVFFSALALALITSGIGLDLALPATAGGSPGRTLWAAGDNLYGQLGDGSTTPSLSLEQVGTGIDWSQVSASNWTTSGVAGDGTLWLWGLNDLGQLGNGSTTNELSPSQVGVNTDWVQVSGSLTATAAIKADGSLWMWGDNKEGELGTGTNSGPQICTPSSQSIPCSTVPLQVGSDTDWKQVSDGASHVAAIKTDGTLWTWGEDEYGELGDGGSGSGSCVADSGLPCSSVPHQVGTDSDWVAVSAGYFDTFAIKADGTLWAWGAAENGALGNGTTSGPSECINGPCASTPIQVGAGGDWTQVSTYLGDTLAIQANGSLWGWGTNTDGQLGDGTTIDRLSPVQVGGGSDWKEVSPGFANTAAVQDDGTLWAWGDNSTGALADGSDTGPQLCGSEPCSMTPVQIGSGSDWSAAVAGGGRMFGLKDDRAAQGITFTSTAPSNASTGSPSYTISATGGASGNAVTFSSETPSVCALSGSTVSFVGAGPCTIDANQTGNANYLPAPQVQQSFSVSQGSQTITFTSTPPAPAIAGASPYTVTATGGGSGNPVTFSSATDSICTVSGSTVSFVGAGTCTIDADQAGNAAYLQAPTATENIFVVSSADAITSPATATAYVGSMFSFPITTTGSSVPGIRISGILPAGLTFTNNGDGTGLISGTPPAITTVGMYSFRTGKLYHPTIIATFRSGRTVKVVKQLLMLAVDQSPIITSVAMKTDKVGVAFTFKIVSKGYPEAVPSETGALPNGVSFTDIGDGKATLAGTPQAGTAGTYPITITADNGVGTPATQTFTLTVKS